MNSHTSGPPLLLCAVALSLAFDAARYVRKLAFPKQQAAGLTTIA